MLNPHFTRKGPGRIHCFAGVNKKIQSNDMNLEQEWATREKYGAITETFYKRYRKQYKTQNRDAWKDRILKKLRSIFTRKHGS